MHDRRALDPAKVVDTIAALHRRILERFPGAGLAKVCAELLTLAEENSARARGIARRNLPLRITLFVLLALGAVGLVWIAQLVYLLPRSAENVFSVLQGLEAGANLIVLLGAVMFFLFRIEENLKRRKALAALHELRSIIHVIDMHQLTKDPSFAVTVGGKTASSPLRVLSPFEVNRYLDYCSEMLSLTSKVAVLFAQSFRDEVVTEAVSDIERIAAGLSQKIWQKIMVLQNSTTMQPAEIAPPASAAQAAAARFSPAPTS